MSKSRRDTRSEKVGFDKVLVNKADGTKLEVLDMSHFLGNSEARVRQDVVVQISTNLPAKHIVGELIDGVYVVGTFKHETVVKNCTVVVLEPFDKPVVISLGTADEPTKYLANFEATKARGTIEVQSDCNSFIIEGSNDEIIATVAGTDAGLTGKIAFIFDTHKLGVSTLFPSN